MRFKGLALLSVSIALVFMFTANAFAFDLFLTGAEGFYKMKNYKTAFNQFDQYAKSCEKKATDPVTESYLICSKDDEKEITRKGAEHLYKSFYCYYMAAMSLEKLGKPADAVNYYLKALYMTRTRQQVTFVNKITRKKTVKFLVYDITPKEINQNYDRLYQLGTDTWQLLEKIRSVGEIRRDLAYLIENGIDPEKQGEYKARFAVCQKSEKNLCVLLENFVIYEMNRGVYDKFDVFVNYLNNFKPITHAVDGILSVAKTSKENLANIISNSTNPVSVPSIETLKQKLTGLGEIIDYMDANIK